MEVLAAPAWHERERAHTERVDAATAAHRARRAAGRRHPVEDFLFTYYARSVAALRRWHPGLEVGLEVEVRDERAGWQHYRLDDGVLAVDAAGYLAARRSRVQATRRLLVAVLGRTAHYGCFGLHEWAMVHRLDQGAVRHPEWPLRLGPRGTDAVVDSHQLTCSHADAFRFFTPSARPLNAVQPTRREQEALEQPGCLHAGMDCYRLAYQLLPVVPSELVADCFDLAREIRTLDMRASPYDLRALGYEPVRVETREGKAEYVAGQRRFADRSQHLRRRLLDIVDRLLAAAT